MPAAGEPDTVTGDEFPSAVIARFASSFSFLPVPSTKRHGLLRLQHKSWAPVLPFLALLVDPQHAFTDEILDGCLGPGPGPSDVNHQHGYCDVSKNLDRFQHSTLICIELLGDRAYVRLAADLDNRV